MLQSYKQRNNYAHFLMWISTYYSNTEKKIVCMQKPQRHNSFKTRLIHV